MPLLKARLRLTPVVRRTRAIYKEHEKLGWMQLLYTIYGSSAVYYQVIGNFSSLFQFFTLRLHRGFDAITQGKTCSFKHL